MISIPDPYENPDPWGKLLCSGIQVPGILTAVGVPDQTYEWAEQNGFGATKVLVYRAANLIKGAAFTHFIPRGTWNDVLQFMGIIRPGFPRGKTKKPSAFSWTHPALQWVGAERMVVQAYGPPTQLIPNDRAWWYTIKIDEYVPKQTVKTGEPEPAKPNGTPQPKDAFEQAIATALLDWQKT